MLYSIVWIYLIVQISHSPFDGNLGDIQFGTVVSKTTLNKNLFWYLCDAEEADS